MKVVMIQISSISKTKPLTKGLTLMLLMPSAFLTWATPSSNGTSMRTSRDSTDQTSRAILISRKRGKDTLKELTSTVTRMQLLKTRHISQLVRMDRSKWGLIPYKTRRWTFQFKSLIGIPLQEKIKREALSMLMNISRIESSWVWRMASFAFLSMLTRTQYLSIILEWFQNYTDISTVTEFCQRTSSQRAQPITRSSIWGLSDTKFWNNQTKSYHF